MRVLTFCTCLLFIFSCGSNLVYEKSYEFKDGIWNFNNPAEFDFSLADSDIKYDLQLDIEHNTSYPFENLYLRIKTEFPDQSMVYDTLSVELVNNQGGWIGKCSGDNCYLKVILQEQTKFKDAGDHRITFEQFTREEKLDGVNSMGFSLIVSKDD